ncbi:MAG: tRNA (adenosine(37)-N6)-dimethylallyltransferase MiaA [Bacteriovoracaceae bacterium]
MQTQSKILILSGPTATGKTDFAIKLAKLFDLTIINFDSLCFYKELLIGSARPTDEELIGTQHYLIGTESIFALLNAADFWRKASAIIQSLSKENKNILLVGGSGFYLNTLLHGMFESTTTPKLIQEKSDIVYQENGIEAFLSILKEVDPKNFERLHPNDHYRIRRAVEHYWTTNTPFSQAKDNLVKESGIINQFAALHLYFDIPKSEHREIILNRVNQMIHKGFQAEVANLLKNYPKLKENKALNSIGYKEMQQYLRGEISSLENCIEKIAIATHQLAKHQRTWFQKIVDKKVFNPLTDESQILIEIERFISNS